jgi:uncharacterized membrane protein YedE/YeeE
MTNPAKVLGFLDVAGSWDPSLAFVMGAALVVYASAFRISQAEPGSFSFDGIDARLLVGAATFGLGWGLAGFCPGPAIASLVIGSGQVALFVAAMVAGMGIFKLVAEPRPRRSEPAAPLNAP